MSDIAIKVENLSKLYQLGQIGTGTLSRDLERWWAQVRGKEDPFAKIGQVNDRSKKSESDFVWALRDINFEVKKGEVLGIIGRNGAGKSTLLKVLSKITAPSSGKIYVEGRIASLLEVGTGFHPEMTGRENIFMNGALLGMRKWEIKKKFDEIVDFAGVEAYIDTPVKRYSSGMYVRLAFAVAAFLEPEILIVDEVLAVGDAEFQKKCLGRMKDVSVNEGRTVLFVSHNIPMVQKLCNKGLLLKDGTLKFEGEILRTLEKYTAIQKTEPNYISENIINKEACILSASLLDEHDKECSEVAIGMKWKLKVKFQVNQNTKNLISGIGILNHNDFPINTTWNMPIDAELGFYEAIFENDFLSLAIGQYKIVVGLSQGKRSIDYVDNSFFFEVVPMIDSISENILSLESSTGVILNQLKTQIIKTV